MPNPRILDAINKYRAELERMEAEAARHLIGAYARLYDKLLTDLRALEADIADLGDAPTKAQVRKLQRFSALLEQVAKELTKYAAVVEDQVGANRTAAAQLATKNARALIQLALPNLPASVQAQLLASFQSINPAAIETLLGALKSGPLAELFEVFGKQAALELGNAILDGVALGYNPRKIAERMAQVLGGNLTRALTISRTEMLRAYRAANLAHYAANRDIVKGWQWVCTQSARRPCCLACLALDGRVFPVEDAFMQAHPNCRCVPVPVTVTYKDLGLDVGENTPPPLPTAKEWFETLTPAEQQRFFSKAAWKAFRSGAVTLDDFIGVQTSPDWGDAFVEKSLREILGDGATKFYWN